MPTTSAGSDLSAGTSTAQLTARDRKNPRVDTGPTRVGDAPGGLRRRRRHPQQGEQADRGLAVAVRVVEHERHRGPQRREAGEPERAVRRPAAQHRLLSESTSIDPSSAR